MSAAPLDVNVAIDAVLTRKVPMPVMAGAAGAVVLGLVAFVAGLVIDPVWTWGAVIVGLVYTMGICQGAIMFSIISTLTWARWSRPMKRVAETFGLFMPFLYLAMVAFLVVGLKVFPWHPHTIVLGGPVNLNPESAATMFAAKPFWLNPWVFSGRLIVGVGFMVLLDLVYLRTSLRPDLLASKQRLGDKAPGWWNMIIGGATDVAKERESSDKLQGTLGVILGVTYAFVMSMVAFDLIMSLSPLWYSNMFGGWIFASSFWLSMQAIGVFSLVGLDWLGLRGWIKPSYTHDLGKLLLAYTMAWAYMCFAQILPIYYANMPEETDFLLIRLMLPAWAPMTRVVAVLCFIMPFTVLLSRGIKKMRGPFIALMVCMMIGVFLERTLLVMPSIHKGPDFPWVNFLVISLGVWVGFLGALVTFATQILAKMPALPVSDPKLETHPWDVHVHAHAHGAAH
jgi:hypothetical protein